MLHIGNTLTAEQRLMRNRVEIANHNRYKALGGILMTGAHGIGESPYGTAHTNGRDETYDRRMIDALSDANVRYVILHENYHKMYRHLDTWIQLFKLDPKCANAACDHMINLRLNADNYDGFAVMPTGDYKGLADLRFKGMNAKQIFDILYQEKKDGGGGSGEGEGSGEGDGQGGNGFDSHDWEGAQSLTEQEKKDLARDLDEAIRQGALAAGKAGAGTELIDMEELLTPQVNWREVMREFITTTCQGRDYSTYSRPNRRYMGTGVYMPSGVSEQVGELIFAFDMSGSTSLGKMRSTFMTEGQDICDTLLPEKVRILYWDTQVSGDELYTGDAVRTMSKDTKPVGGGGTVVECVSNYVKDNNINPQAIVIFTDGDIFGSYGTWTCPVLWVIVDAPGWTADCGKVIHVDSSLA